MVDRFTCLMSANPQNYPIRSKNMMQEHTEKSSALGEVKEIESYQYDKQKAIIEKNKVMIFHLLKRPIQIKMYS